jgi:hypothetical protein
MKLERQRGKETFRGANKDIFLLSFEHIEEKLNIRCLVA